VHAVSDAIVGLGERACRDSLLSVILFALNNFCKSSFAIAAASYAHDDSSAHRKLTMSYNSLYTVEIVGLMSSSTGYFDAW
jgi:hypothetical protein